MDYEAITKEIQEAILRGEVISPEFLDWDVWKDHFIRFGFRLAISENAVQAIRERYEQVQQPQTEPQVEPQPIAVQPSADEGKKDVGLL